MGDFPKRLGIPTILMGFGLPDDGLHSPNEKFSVENYYKGIRTVAHFFEKYGATAVKKRGPGWTFSAARHSTVKLPLVEFVPPGVVTVIGPLDAPAGTVAQT